jgi:hypothetical protein
VIAQARQALLKGLPLFDMTAQRSGTATGSSPAKPSAAVRTSAKTKKAASAG